MRVCCHHSLLFSAICLAILGFYANAALADEIRLKDGKKLHGVIVAYEDNMFKVKTDFGYVLVEKDKIASIIPDTAAQPDAAKSEPAAKSGGTTDAKATPKAEPVPAKKEKSAAAAANAHPEVPVPTKATEATSPELKTAVAAPKTTLTATATPPPPPKEEPPVKHEEVQGNLYINHDFGFRMYKAPSWQIIDGAGQALPNAIVAMGTSNESTLLVVGHEKTKAPLEAAARDVESRLHEVYENYRLLSQRKTVVGGRPAMEYRYRGLAEEHDWSGTLSVIANEGDVLTVLGMTYADNDLIQIQENVITRSIASLDFNVK